MWVILCVGLRESTCTCEWVTMVGLMCVRDRVQVHSYLRMHMSVCVRIKVCLHVCISLV